MVTRNTCIIHLWFTDNVVKVILWNLFWDKVWEQSTQHPALRTKVLMVEIHKVKYTFVTILSLPFSWFQLWVGFTTQKPSTSCYFEGLWVELSYYYLTSYHLAWSTILKPDNEYNKVIVWGWVHMSVSCVPRVKQQCCTVHCMHIRYTKSYLC